MNLICGFLSMVALLNLAFGSDCDQKVVDFCSESDKIEKEKVEWREFDWKAYVEKDWIEEVDAADPTLRFGVDLRRSIEIGAVRNVPDNRYGISASTQYDL